MEQKTAWMRYLMLALIISHIAILSSSCKDDFFTIIAENHFINQTNYSITFPVGYEKFNVSPRSTVIVTERGKGAGKGGIQESDFTSPLFSVFSGSPLILKFDQSKCLIDIKVEDENSIRNIKNFKTEKLGDNHYKFTYTFTEADYNRATTCP